MIYHLPPGMVKANASPPKARASTWQERRMDSLKKIPQATYTAYCALSHGHGKDHMLGRLDDATRTLGVAGIAGMASLGVNQPGASLPLWLGGASWLGAMALTPQIINGAVRLKTGVNLNTKYLSSNGEIRPLYQDPNYFVVQAMSKEERTRLANRLGISTTHPDSPNIFMDKLRQIAVQAHTWWMLMAGIATPVLAAVICDTLEDPFKQFYTQFRQWRIIRNNVTPALTGKNPKQIVEAVEKLAQVSTGSGSEVTALSRWWKQLPNAFINNLKLSTLPQKVLLDPSSEVRFNHITTHLADHLRPVSNRVSMQTLIKQQKAGLNAALAPIESLLRHDKVKGLIADSPVLSRVEQQVQLARETAESTLNNFQQLLKVPVGRVSKAKARELLKTQMDKPVIAYVEQLNRTGNVNLARQLTGPQYDKVSTSLAQSRFGPAFEQMGESTKSFLLRSLNSLGLRRRWIRRFPGTLGGGMIAATLLFTAFVLGRDFNQRRPT